MHKVGIRVAELTIFGMHKCYSLVNLIFEVLYVLPKICPKMLHSMSAPAIFLKAFSHPENGLLIITQANRTDEKLILHEWIIFDYK